MLLFLQKITLIKKENLSEVVPKISEFANTQNVVKKADFSSRHAFHIDIKNLSNKIRTSEGKQWFYERMRGEYQMQKMKQKDLGKDKKSRYLEVFSSKHEIYKRRFSKVYKLLALFRPTYCMHWSSKKFCYFYEFT